MDVFVIFLLMKLMKMKRIIYNYTNINEVHLMKESDKYLENLINLIRSNKIETLYIYDSFWIFEMLNLRRKIKDFTLPNIKKLNLKSIKLKNQDLSDFSLIFPSLECFYTEETIKSSTLVNFLENKKNLKEIHRESKDLTDSFISEYFDSSKTKKDLEVFTVYIREGFNISAFLDFLKNKMTTIRELNLNLPSDNTNYNQFLSDLISLRNLEYLVINYHNDIPVDIFKNTENNIKCLIHLRKDLKGFLIFHFIALKESYDIDFLKNYENYDGVQKLVLDSVNLNNSVIDIISKMTIEKLIIRNTLLKNTILLGNMMKGNLSIYLKSLSFDNIKSKFGFWSVFEEMDSWNLKSLSLSNMNLENVFQDVDQIKSTINVVAFKLDNIKIDCESLKKLFSVIKVTEKFKLINTNYDIKSLNNLFNNNDNLFSIEVFIYKMNNRTIHSVFFNSIMNIKPFKKLILIDYDEELRSKFIENYIYNGKKYYLVKNTEVTIFGNDFSESE